MRPVLFELGPLTLYSYGLTITLGFLAAVILASRRAAEVGIPPSKIQSIALTALLFGLLGARLAYVILFWDLYRPNPWEILRLDHGGLIFYGGLAGGLLGGGWAIRRAGLRFLKTADILIPPLVLAHAIGRIGCFLNGCCYGAPTTLPWGVVFPPELIYRHPTQLYESAVLVLLFFWLKRLERRSPPDGMVLLTYGLAYGSWRFAVEFIRGDNSTVLWGLTVFQLVSAPLVLLCGWLLLRARLKK